jgi:steroid 5-alpha reductase family enzyme
VQADKIRSRIAEYAAVFGGINLLILLLTALYVSVNWSIHTFASNPVVVIAAWSGSFVVISALVLLIILWLSREPDEDEEEEEEQNAE